jgi:hypothetical protein
LNFRLSSVSFIRSPSLIAVDSDSFIEGELPISTESVLSPVLFPNAKKIADKPSEP